MSFLSQLTSIIWIRREVIFNIKKYFNLRGIQNNRSLANIYVESLYPINDSKDNFDSNLSIELIKKANTEIKSMCKSLDVDYIDMYSELSVEDKLKDDYTEDGINLNEDGYKKVFKVINRYIEDEKNYQLGFNCCSGFVNCFLLYPKISDISAGYGIRSSVRS